MHRDNGVCLSLSLACVRRIKSECESREFKSKYTRFGILGSTDCTARARCMRAYVESSRAAPTRAEERASGRMRATRAAFPCVVGHHEERRHSLCVYRPLPYTASAYALASSESERNGKRKGEGDKRHTIVSRSWIIQARVHGPTHRPFLLTRYCVYP